MDSLDSPIPEDLDFGDEDMDDVAAGGERSPVSEQGDDDCEPSNLADEGICTPTESLVQRAGLAYAEANGQSDADRSQQAVNLPSYLKEISSLASWTVSSHKPGCGVQALRHPSPEMFWQSDGPQPHVLNIHFFKLVAIAHMRINIDYQLDESYTPTRICFLAGTGHHDLQPVCDMRLEQPKGWLDVDLSNVGGEPDEGNDVDYEDEESSLDDSAATARKKGIGRQTLRCMLVQVRVAENHQNGKDTHLRGLQIFARDPTAKRPARKKLVVREPRLQTGDARANKRARMISDLGSIPGMQDADWMGEPELR